MEYRRPAPLSHRQRSTTGARLVAAPPAGRLVLLLILVPILAGTSLSALPQSCDVECVWDPLVACTTSCHNFWDNITTTCGAYNGVCYNVPVCGNDRCEPKPFGSPQWVQAETPSNCPYDCPSGVYSPYDNHCVVNVPAKISALGSRGGSVHRYHLDGGTAGAVVTNEYGMAGQYPRTMGQLWNELDDRNLSKCHVQGFAKFPGGGAADFTFDWNRVGGVGSEWLEYLFGAYCPDDYTPGAPEYPGILMTKPVSSSRVAYGKSFGALIGQTHPGGMQAIGQFLVVGIDSGGTTAHIYFWVYGNPQDPWVASSFEHTVTRAEAVAIGRLASGKYLLLIGSEQGTRMSVYRSSTTSLYSTAWSYLGDFRTGVNWAGPSDSDYNYNNLTILKECGSNDLYLAGLTNNHYPDCFGNRDSCDKSVIDLHKITTTGNVGGYGLQRLFDVTLDNPCDCFLCFDICPNFAAGGGLEARPDGNVNAYATEHWNDGSDLDVLEW